MLRIGRPITVASAHSLMIFIHHYNKYRPHILMYAVFFFFNIYLCVISYVEFVCNLFVVV